jgi:phage gpG-like protein
MKIQSLWKAYDKAVLYTLAKLGSLAHAEAIKNSKKQFIGRGDRTLTGRLMNSIFWRVGKHEGKDTAFVGVRGIPYGRIHEYGGKITPKKSKFLWVRSPYAARKGSKFKNFTPSDFYNAVKTDPTHYFYGGSFGSTGTAMYKRGKTFEALFFLKKSVWIPERPYLRPAATVASSKFNEYFNAAYGDLFTKV